MSAPVLVTQHLNFSYDKTEVLENINLTIQPGEFIGIFGPNGGGKTTFLKLLMGFLQPSQGTIHLFGKSPSEARLKIGYVPQSVRLDRAFPISVIDVVLMGRLSKLKWWGGWPKESRKKACQALDQVGLLHMAEAPFGTLSGGQAQRVLIARAIVGDPDLLLLDEPTASVDPLAEKEIHDLLTELSTQLTIFMVTHDLQSVLGLAKRLLCIHRTATLINPKEVCEHFALGLYHTPLSSKDHFSWK